MAEAGHAPNRVFIDQNGNLNLNGAQLLDASGNNVAKVVAAPSAGVRIVGGQLTTASAADTVATGLATVVAVIACLDSDPGDDPEWVSATIGDQAGSPAAGSVIIKTWKNTSGTDPTPVAAGTFGKKVNWIAIGT